MGRGTGTHLKICYVRFKSILLRLQSNRPTSMYGDGFRGPLSFRPFSRRVGSTSLSETQARSGDPKNFRGDSLECRRLHTHSRQERSRILRSKFSLTNTSELVRFGSIDLRLEPLVPEPKFKKHYKQQTFNTNSSTLNRLNT